MKSVGWVFYSRWSFDAGYSHTDLAPPAPNGSELWMCGPDSNWDPKIIRTCKGTSWAGASFHSDQASAQAALDNAERHFSTLPQANEAWYAILRPIRFSGVTNWFSGRGLELDIASHDPGGALAVMTSAGYDEENLSDLPRILDFTAKVDEVRSWYDTLDENVVNGNFQHQHEDIDGMTFSIWKSDEAMMKAAYGAGTHRTYLSAQKSHKLADRTSYLRNRVMASKGTWDGIDPVELTNQPASSDYN